MTDLELIHNYSPNGETQKFDTQYLAKTGQWSPDNPYRDALLNTKNKKNRQSLFNSAMSWEESRGNANFENAREDYLLDRQRQLELEDRAHQEEYDSPVAQAARMRAAGINPDLQQVSGGSSLDPQNEAGSAASQQSAGLETPQPTDDLDIINTVISGVGTLASAATGVFSIFSGAKLLPSQVALNKASADLMGAQKSASDMLTPTVKAMNEATTAGLNLKNARQSNENVMYDFSNIGQFVKTLSASTNPDGSPADVSSDSVVGLMNKLGYQTASGKPVDELVKSYFSNADVRAAASASRFSLRKNLAVETAVPYELLQQTFGYIAQGQNLRAFADMSSARIASFVQGVLSSSEEFLNDQVSIAQGQASIEADQTTSLDQAGYGRLKAAYIHNKLQQNYEGLVNLNRICCQESRRFQEIKQKLCPDGDVSKLAGNDLIAYNAACAGQNIVDLCGHENAQQLSAIMNQLGYTVSAISFNGSTLKGTDPYLDRHARFFNFIYNPSVNGQTAFGDMMHECIDWFGEFVKDKTITDPNREDEQKHSDEQQERSDKKRSAERTGEFVRNVAGYAILHSLLK